MRLIGRVGAAILIAGAAGCVPLKDYRALEKRFTEQDQYVVDHKGKVRDLERREQVLTLRAREQERQLDLLRARLEKSETLRNRLAERLKAEPAALPASAPRDEPPPMVMGLEVNPLTQGLVLENGVMFEPGKAILKPKGKEIIERLVTELNGPKYQGRQVRIEGHTDDTPIKRSGHDSNWDLSAKRALAVLHHLEEKGIPSSRLCFSGYGPHKPLDSGTDTKAKSRNRRVEIVLFE